MTVRPDDATSVVVLVGAGVSLASGVPSFRDRTGLWGDKKLSEVASPEAWATDRDSVREIHDQHRIDLAPLLPNDAHEALARLQQRWGPERVTLANLCVDSMLEKAGAPHPYELLGSLFRLRCEADASHAAVGVFGKQNPSATCRLCGAGLRPDVVWHGERAQHLDTVFSALDACGVYLAVGTSARLAEVQEMLDRAKRAGARTIEINPNPSGLDYDHVMKEPAETAVPRLVAEWLREEA